MIKKLTEHAYSKCHVEIDSMGGIHFISIHTGDIRPVETA